MQKKLKVAALITALTVTISAFTVTTFADSAEAYDITVLDTAITSENAANVLAGSENDGKVSYNAETNTLTLNGASLAYTATKNNIKKIGGISRSAAAAIFTFKDNLTVNLIGENNVSISTTKSTVTVNGIYSDDGLNMTFTGSGSLNVSTSNAKRDTYGIKCGGVLTVNNTAIEAVAGNSTNTKGLYNSQGISASKGIIILGSKVTAISGESASQLSSALYASGDIVISDKSEVWATSKKALRDSYAVYTNNNIKITDSSLNAKTEGASNSATAIVCGTVFAAEKSILNASTEKALKYTTSVWASEAKIDKTQLTASAGEGAEESYGISIEKLTVTNDSELKCTSSAAAYSLPVWSKNLTVSDSIIDAESISATSEAYGISAETFTVNSGKIAAKAGPATDWSIGIWTNEISINGGSVTAQASESNNPQPFTDVPVISNNFKVTVKAGNSKDSAIKIKNPIESTYTSGYYVSVEPYTHTHNWSSDWSANETAHWHICTADDCDITATDKMNGYGSHTFSSKYSFDETSHWLICTECGQKKDLAAHTWDDIKIIRESTAAETGQRLLSCKCGAQKTEEISKLPPTITEGKNISFEIGSKTELSFRSDASFADFLSVTVDGKELEKTDYSLKEGSITVTLKAEYLNTLSAGTHTLSINSLSGSAATDFTVNAQSVKEDTGDFSHYALYTFILLAMLGAFISIKRGKNV